MSTHTSNIRPKPDKVLTDIADYVSGHAIESAEAYNTARLCLIDTLGCGLEALEYPACTKLLGPDRSGNGGAERREGPGHALPARPRHRRIQHRGDDPLAGFQRHLAGGGMGTSLGQPGRHPRRCGLALAHPARAGQGAASHARRADRHDQGARDPGRDRAREQLQPRRARPRRAGEGGDDRGGHSHDGRHARRDRRRALQRLDRRAVAAHLPPRAQRRAAQVVGGGRCRKPRRAHRVDDA